MPADIHSEIIALIPRILNNSFLIGITARECVIAIIGTSTDADTLILGKASLINLVLPVSTYHLIYISIFVCA